MRQPERRLRRWTGWTLLWGVVAAAPAGAHLRIGLAPAVEVAADRLRLSDLLPPAAPEAIRTAAAAVDLGHAPQPGKRRVLDRSFILARLAAQPRLRDALETPASVVVSRTHRRIGAADLQPVVAAALRDAHCAELLPLMIGGLTMPDAILSAEPEPRLEVLGFEADAPRAAVRVRLRAGPGAPPFYATFPSGAAETACTALAPTLPPASAPAEPARGAPASASPILVRTGQPATLQAVGRGMKLLVPVTPLQHGRLGDEIRVRNLENQSVILGVVVAPNLLERSF